MGFFGKSDDEKFRDKLKAMKNSSKLDENLTYEQRQAKIAKKEPVAVKKVTQVTPIKKKGKGLGMNKYDDALSQFESGTYKRNDVSGMIDEAKKTLLK